MAITYEPIATSTLGSAAATITFSSIPATYTDLRIVLVAQDASTGGTTVSMRFNSTTTGYSDTRIYGSGASAASASDTFVSEIPISIYGVPASPEFTLYEIDIFSYAGATNKTSLISAIEESTGVNNYIGKIVGLWRNTAAITSVSLLELANFNTGTTATLYGIKNA